MNSITSYVARWMLGIGCVTLFSSYVFAQQPSKSTIADRIKQPFSTEVKHIGMAEIKTVVKTGYFPQRQPEVYWHDQDWNIDLIIRSTDDSPDSLSIRSSGGAAQVVTLPDDYRQVNSIFRGPNDKAIIDADCGGSCGGFIIIDLKLGKVIDDFGKIETLVSPNGRFILYLNGYSPHAGTFENQYHLYDTMKTPRENVCGYRQNDPMHKDLDEEMRGFQVYPQSPGQILCVDEDDDDDNMAANFTWDADSSKIVFADKKSGVMSLVVVTMPVGAKDLPRTSVYHLIGAEDVCAGATDAAGNKYCDYHVIKSLGWDGDTVKASFQHRFGSKLDLEKTIPLSKFAPIGK